MSHFTVLVIGENPDDQLAPFDENLDTPKYVKYTKEQLIEKAKEYIEEYKTGTYAEFLADPNQYKKDHGNHKAHIDYLEKEFPLKLNWSDEEIYQDAIQWYEPEDIGENGEVYSERNPNSKWDWYELGGRWTGLFKKKEVVLEETRFKTGRPGLMTEPAEPGMCDQALKRDIANLNEIQTFAVVKDGKWYERGEMGWWGIVSNEKEKDQWETEFKKLLEELPDDTLLSIYDCHI